ncbi:MAG: histidine kinase dimerization/phosphoacceptor domain -containing protein [Rhizomicrobium sp.]
MEKLFEQVEDARALAQIIVDTVREPVLVLDSESNILFASASFHRAFHFDPSAALDMSLFALDGGAWDVPALRDLLGDAARLRNIAEPVEISHEFPRIGRRVLCLYARTIAHQPGARPAVTLNIEDITDRRTVEAEKARLKEQADELLIHKEMLLEEMQHRIVNSLQIIASILMLKARAVNSDETRQHLQDAHRRVISVAAVQRHLHSSGRADLIEIEPYLSKLCASLAESMIGDDHAATLKVSADPCQMISADAVSLGLIVTELVINALKYAFPGQPAGAVVTVHLEANGTDWRLSVSDNGIGRASEAPAKGGLGTSLVNALAQQLNAKVESTNSSAGLTVAVTHATFTARGGGAV